MEISRYVEGKLQKLPHTAALAGTQPCRPQTSLTSSFASGAASCLVSASRREVATASSFSSVPPLMEGRVGSHTYRGEERGALR